MKSTFEQDLTETCKLLFYSKSHFENIFYLFRHGRIKIARLLIEANCEMDLGARSRQAENQTPLHFAVRHGHEQIVRLLIEAGCDVNVVRENFTSCYPDHKLSG